MILKIKFLFTDLIKKLELKDTAPSKFWFMIHNCSPTCNCIKVPDETHAIIEFEGKQCEGNGKSEEESVDVAVYKFLYNHLRVTSIHWKYPWEKNLEFSEPMPDHILKQMKKQIQGKNFIHFLLILNY